MLPDAVQFAVEWIYHSSAAINGFLYISLHSSVRHELRRYLPCCRSNSVAPAASQPAGEGGNRLRQDHGNAVAETPGVPAPVMRSSCQRHTARQTTTVF